MRDGFIHAAFALQRHPQIVMRRLQARVEFKRFFKHGHRLIDFPAYFQRITQQVIGRCIAWIERHRLPEMTDGFVHSASGLQHKT